MDDYYEDARQSCQARMKAAHGKGGVFPDYMLSPFIDWASRQGYVPETCLEYSATYLTLSRVDWFPGHLRFKQNIRNRSWVALTKQAASLLNEFFKAVDAGHVDCVLLHVLQQPEPNQEPNSSKGNTMSEKNAAAFLRDNSRSVSVTFVGEGASSKHYTYVTTLDLKKDDYVVVPARDNYALAKVMNAADTLEIDPNSDTKYRWVVAKVDFSEYNDLLTGNEKLEAILRDAYQANAKKAFRDVLMQSLGAGDKKEVNQLLGK